MIMKRCRAIFFGVYMCNVMNLKGVVIFYLLLFSVGNDLKKFNLLPCSLAILNDGKSVGFNFTPMVYNGD